MRFPMLSENLFKDVLDISEEAAQEFEEKREWLVNYVNKAMFAQSDIENLIGHRGADLMINNHRNHAAFISTVICFKKPNVLYDVIPGVYRAYRNQGFSYDYFLRAFECWISALHTVLSPSSAKQIEKIYLRLIELHDDSIMRSKSSQRINRLENVPERWKDAFMKYCKALLSADISMCVEIAYDNCKSRRDACDFMLNVIQPALYWIGDLWERGELTVADEHLATSISVRVMYGLSWMFRDRVVKYGKVTVISISGEQHEIGAWMIAYILESEGWDVVFLGGNVPDRDLFAHLAAWRPHVLAISVTMPFNVPPLKRLIQRIKSESAYKSIKIIVGGHALSLFCDLWKEIGADAFELNAKDVVEKMAQLWEIIKAEGYCA